MLGQNLCSQEDYGLPVTTVVAAHGSLSSFKIISQLYTGQYVMVERSHDEFVELDTTLRNCETFGQHLKKITSPSSTDDLTMDAYLKSILSVLGELMWSCPILLSFLDDSMKQGNIRDGLIAMLCRKTSFLEAAYASAIEKLSHTEARIAFLDSQSHGNYAGKPSHLPSQETAEAAGVETPTTSPPQCDSALGPTSALEASPYGTTPAITTEIKAKELCPALNDGLGLEDVTVVRTPSASEKSGVSRTDCTTMEATEDRRSSWPFHSRGGMEVNSSMLSLLTTTSRASSPTATLSPPPGFATPSKSPVSTSCLASPFRDESFNASPPLFSPYSALSPVQQPPDSHASSRKLPPQASMFDTTPQAGNAVVDRILGIVLPTKKQLAFRQSARACVSRLARRTLNVRVVETGLSALHCSLPDDPMRLTVLKRANLSERPWHAELREAILRSVNAAKHEAFAGDPKAEDKDRLRSVGDASTIDIIGRKPTYILPRPTDSNHLLSHVNVTVSGNDARFECVVDSRLPVEIKPNNRAELCFTVFLEEVARKVGKEDLLKRSLLLVRAWWTYEVPSYIDGNPTNNCLAEDVLAVMVCRVFNLHHVKLHTPLQALATFLAEYSDVNWAECVITLQGVVPFQAPANGAKSIADSANTEHQACRPVPLPEHLLSEAFMHRHLEFYRKRSCANESCANESCANVAGDGDGASFTTPSSSGKMAPTSTPIPVSPASADTVETAEEVEAATVDVDAPAAVVYFKQSGLVNVIHPLTNANLVSPTVTKEQCIKLSLIFETGARALRAALDATDNHALWPEQGIQAAPLGQFFKHTIARYDVAGNILVPDDLTVSMMGQSDTGSGAEGGSAGRGNRCMTAVNVAAIVDATCYIDLVCAGRDSGIAIIMLVEEMLLENGGVLSGDRLGKLLTESVPSDANLLSRMEERYESLLKFLELYPELLAISTDSPENPYVYLRRMLTAEEQDLVARGITPPRLRKAKAMQASTSSLAGVGAGSAAPPSCFGGGIGSGDSTSRKKFSGMGGGDGSSSVPCATKQQQQQQPAHLTGLQQAHAYAQSGGWGGVPHQPDQNHHQHHQQQLQEKHDKIQSKNQMGELRQMIRQQCQQQQPQQPQQQQQQQQQQQVPQQQEQPQQVQQRHHHRHHEQRQQQQYRHQHLHQRWQQQQQQQCRQRGMLHEQQWQQQQQWQQRQWQQRQRHTTIGNKPQHDFEFSGGGVASWPSTSGSSREWPQQLHQHPHPQAYAAWSGAGQNHQAGGYFMDPDSSGCFALATQGPLDSSVHTTTTTTESSSGVRTHTTISMESKTVWVVMPTVPHANVGPH